MNRARTIFAQFAFALLSSILLTVSRANAQLISPNDSSSLLQLQRREFSPSKMGSFVSTTFTYVAILFVLQLMIGTTFSFPELRTKRAIISAFFSSTLLVSLIYFFGIFFAFFNAIGTLFALITLFTLATLLQASLYAWVFRAPKKHIAIYAIASSILIIIPLMIFS